MCVCGYESVGVGIYVLVFEFVYKSPCMYLCICVCMCEGGMYDQKRATTHPLAFHCFGEESGESSKNRHGCRMMPNICHL